MNVLVADDDAVSRTLLVRFLRTWGYTVTEVVDGCAAWQALSAADAPRLAILDWMMPGLDGPEVCRKLRGLTTADPVYVILLTSRDTTADVVTGLEAGANDYVVKPFDPTELRARVRVGQTVLDLQGRLAARIHELEKTLAEVRRLHGLLPICAWCKKVRNDQNYWQQVEEYLRERADIRFSHGICPECERDVIGPQLHGPDPASDD